MEHLLSMSFKNGQDGRTIVMSLNLSINILETIERQCLGLKTVFTI